jgi:hypothetical protein
MYVCAPALPIPPLLGVEYHMRTTFLMKLTPSRARLRYDGRVYIVILLLLFS